MVCSMGDRRKNTRLCVKLKATLFICGNEVNANILDISETGLCLSVPIKLLQSIDLKPNIFAQVQFLDTVLLHSIKEDYIEQVPVKIIYYMPQDDAMLIGCTTSSQEYAKYVSMKKTCVAVQCIFERKEKWRRDKVGSAL